MSMAMRNFLTAASSYTNIRSVTYSALNPVQVESLNENCLLVNTSDEVIGSASKRVCHLVAENDHIPLHRAFSVFLFNTKNELLIQRRSDTKITFPSCFTNSCCSHPLVDIEDEKIEEDALGVKLAAIRRLNVELGIPKEELSPDDFTYLTRIIYKSLGDGVWGEHEIDYILILIKDLTIKPNPEEVSEICYLKRSGFESFITNLKHPLTPWFNIIARNRLLLWWDNLDTLGTFIDHKTIYSFDDENINHNKFRHSH